MAATLEQLAAVADPATSAQNLADLAHAEPDLWQAIAAHPNVYPGLLDWMREYAPAEAGPEPGPQPGGVEPEGSAPVSASAHQPAGGIESEPAPEPSTGHDSSGLQPGSESQPESEPDLEPLHSELDVRSRPVAQEPTRLSRLSKYWLSGRRRTGLIVGTSALAAATLVAILLVNLVVVPQQQAAQAARHAHQDAVAAFERTKSECLTANRDLESGIERGAATIETDPSTLDDPSLIAPLTDAVSTAKAASHCTVPTMATGTGAIVKQTSALSDTTDAVKQAVDALSKASDAVAASVDKKTRAAAEAAAAAQAAAAAAAAAQRTWHFTSGDGYAFDLTVSVGAPTKSGTLGTYNVPSGCKSLSDAGCTTKTVSVGEGCSGFDPKTMIAVPITVTFTARTEKFDTPIAGAFQVDTAGSYRGPNQVGYGFLGSYVKEEAVYSSGPDCASNSAGGPRFNVSWPDALAAGRSYSHTFDILIEKWTSPNAPGGDTALLDWIAVQPDPVTPQGSAVSYSPDSSKRITLKGNVVGG